MCIKKILLCFLPIFLKPSLSNADDCNAPDAYIDKTMIIGGNRTSITFRMKLGHCLNFKLKGTMVYYKPTPPVILPASMFWDSHKFVYKLTPHYEYDGGRLAGYPGNLFTPSTPGEETFTIGDLLPDTMYEFTIESYRTKGYKSETMTRRTGSYTPSSPPITGTGCFRVEIPRTWNSKRGDELLRDVWVYWKQVYDTRLWYKLTVYQYDANDKLVEEKSFANCLSNSSVYMRLNYNRHRFVFSSFNDYGNSTARSVVEVPAQNYILPPLLPTLYNENNMENYTLLVSWEAPKHVNVTSYTLVWYDTRIGWVNGTKQEYEYINDFDILDKSTTIVKIKNYGSKNGDGLFAVSANVEKGSSGLTFPKFNDRPFMNLNEFVSTCRSLS